MLLTITTTHRPATDLGYLLHKHPERAQQVPVSTGTAHIFYPEATEERCTAALLVDVDPVAFVRGQARRRDRGRRGSGPLAQYVNDRPYAAGSQLAVALKAVFGTALRGRCDIKPELADMTLPLRISVPAMSVRAGASLAERLFAPLGWTTQITHYPYDPETPEWGPAPCANVQLDGVFRIADALNHLYVLLPVLDGGQHYWVAESDVSKLLRASSSWLPSHPERELITGTYLAWAAPLVDAATEQLDMVDRISDASAPSTPPRESADARGLPLSAQRYRAVADCLARAGARRVLDLGCGDGALLEVLLRDRQYTELAGVDVSPYALRFAARRLHIDRADSPASGSAQRARVTLRQSSLMYADPALRGFDAAVLVEVIEHIDPARLPAAAEAVFGVAQPRLVLVTTPNAEYNDYFPALPRGAFRHPDHRFEWTRAEFASWAQHIATEYAYSVAFEGIGHTSNEEAGAPTQMAIFTKGGPS